MDLACSRRTPCTGGAERSKGEVNAKIVPQGGVALARDGMARRQGVLHSATVNPRFHRGGKQQFYATMGGIYVKIARLLQLDRARLLVHSPCLTQCIQIDVYILIFTSV